MSSFKRALNWLDYISNHPNHSYLDSHIEEELNLVKLGEDFTSSFSKLLDSPSSLLLTYDPFGDQVYPSFLHTTVGSNVLGMSPTAIGLTGFGPRAIPLVFSPLTFNPMQSAALTPPSVTEILKSGPSAVAATQTMASSAFPKFAILPSCFIEVVNLTDLCPATIFTKLIVILSDVDCDYYYLMEDDENQHSILGNLLFFLWATSQENHTSKFGPCASATVNRTDIMHKCTEFHHAFLVSSSPPPKGSLSHIDHDSIIKSAISAAMAAVPTTGPDCMTSAEEELAKQKELEKNKGFSKLDDNSRQHLLAIASDGVSIPTDIPPRFKEILNAKNGAAVVQKFQKWHPDEDMQMNKGMSHNLANGNVLSTDENTIDNFAIHFVPPSSSQAVDMVTQKDMLQWQMLSANNDLSQDDTDAILENKIYLPKDFL